MSCSAHEGCPAATAWICEAQACEGPTDQHLVALALAWSGVAEASTVLCLECRGSRLNERVPVPGHIRAIALAGAYGLGWIMCLIIGAIATAPSAFHTREEYEARTDRWLGLTAARWILTVGLCVQSRTHARVRPAPVSVPV